MLLVRAQAPTSHVVDWAKLRGEILERYRALVQMDTTAGHETLAVDYLKKVLEAEGIPTKTFALDPNRANLVARLKGNGTKRPLLILAHTDVVGVQREKWPVDPFGAVIKDGYIWGRGSKDDKPVLAANLMAMLLLKRLDVPLDRDVIFLAESGEEADPTGVGINFMVREHFDEIDAEFAHDRGRRRDDRQRPRDRRRASARPKSCPRACAWWRPARPVMAPFRAWTTRSFTSRPRSRRSAGGRRRCG